MNEQNEQNLVQNGTKYEQVQGGWYEEVGRPGVDFDIYRYLNGYMNRQMKMNRYKNGKNGMNVHDEHERAR